MTGGSGTRLPGRLWPGALWWSLSAVVLAISLRPVVTAYLIDFPDEIWQVDLEVYREGARSLTTGRPVYDWLTDNPQYLPFTYPPFAALIGTPLLLLPFGAIGWAWSALQVLLLWTCTGIAFRPLLERFTASRPLAQAVVVALLIQLQPVQEGIRFGQVNAVVVTLCLVDLGRRRAGWWPRGSLAGVATAIKLTPGVFWIHFAVTRNWRALRASVATAALVTTVTALFAPSASAAFWTEALWDPGRLGPNANTQNQSLRGVLMRIGPQDAQVQSLTWLILAVVLGIFGFWVAARLDRRGHQVAVVAVLGMLAVLVSPVSWTHHLYWGVVVLGALLGDARRWSRVVVAALGTVLLVLPWPWWGASWQQHQGWLRGVGFVVEQADCWFAVASLIALWWFLARGRPGADSEEEGAVGDPVGVEKSTGALAAG